MKNKKCISPVVAVALLLIVAVAAIVSFHTWFSGYQSGVFTDTEIKSNEALDNTLKIEDLIDNTLYIVNNVRDGLNVNELKINGNVCILTNLSLGMNEIDVTNCLSGLSTSTPDIVLITEKNVVSKKVYYDSLNSSSVISFLNCSALNGGEWVLVPGDSDLGTSDFCVMKYEATNWAGSIGMSREDSPPSTGTPQTSVITQCDNLNNVTGNYHLITNNEWVTIARNVEIVSANWIGGVIGSTIASGGGLKRGNLGFVDSTAYNGNDPEYGSGRDAKASLELTNGEVIWDFSGNLHEWVDFTFNSNVESAMGTAGGTFEWSNISGHDSFKSSNLVYNSTHGIGMVYADNDDAWPSGTIHAIVRGGSHSMPTSPSYQGWGGIYWLDAGKSPSSTDVGLGYRCAYTP